MPVVTSQQTANIAAADSEPAVSLQPSSSTTLSIRHWLKKVCSSLEWPTGLCLHLPSGSQNYNHKGMDENI
ncbi:hypothetical protein ACFX12_019986 [Malus domestica]